MAGTDWEAKIREQEYFSTSIFKDIFKDTTKKYIAANALIKAIKIASKIARDK